MSGFNFFKFASRRSTVYSAKGIVSCSQPLAAQAGLEILQQGGNAADAAVAVSAALNITEPTSCGIGGDAFCLFYDASTKKVSGLNGSGRAPAALTIDFVRRPADGPGGGGGVPKGEHIPHTNINSITVPGAAAAWADTVEKYGSGKLSLAQVLAPAIRLAEEGVPVHELTSLSWQLSENLIRNASPSGEAMLLNGHAPKSGQVMRMPDLAKTFRLLGEKGKAGYYTGRVAESIVEVIRNRGGLMTLEDLASHTSTEIEPISYTYRGVTLHECPPNGQGITALMALGIIEAIEESGAVKPLVEMDLNSTEYLHILIESLRIAFADTAYYVADPDVTHVPVKELLSKEYLQKRAKLFNPQKAAPDFEKGAPVASSDTVQFSVTDQWGNGCSFICSNYKGFGNGAIPKGCGFTLQSRGNGFVLEEGHPNALEGGKRPYHTIIPALATKGDELYLTYGCMGGYMQPQGHVQILLALIRGLTPQQAVDMPRFSVAPSSEELGKAELEGDEVNTQRSSPVFCEDTFDEEVVEGLRGLGHRIEVVTNFARLMMGKAQVIEKIKDGESFVWAAGSDPRGDGHAVAQI